MVDGKLFGPHQQEESAKNVQTVNENAHSEAPSLPKLDSILTPDDVLTWSATSLCPTCSDRVTLYLRRVLDSGNCSKVGVLLVHNQKCPDARRFLEKSQSFLESYVSTSLDERLKSLQGAFGALWRSKRQD